MICLDHDERIAFAEGAVGAARAGALRTHVASCIACRAQLVALGRLVTDLRAPVTGPDGPSGRREVARVMRRLDEPAALPRHVTPRRGRLRGARRWVAWLRRVGSRRGRPRDAGLRQGWPRLAFAGMALAGIVAIGVAWAWSDRDEVTAHGGEAGRGDRIAHGDASSDREGTARDRDAAVDREGAARDPDAAAADREFMMRGGGGELTADRVTAAAIDRVVGTTVFAIDAPARGPAPLAAGARVSPTTPFVLGYRNLARGVPLFALAFAVDARGEVHWLYPGFAARGEDPQAVALATTDATRLMPDGAVLEGVAPGPLRVVVVISAARLRVSAVDRLRGDALTTPALRRRFAAAAISELRLEVAP